MATYKISFESSTRKDAPEPWGQHIGENVYDVPDDLRDEALVSYIATVLLTAGGTPRFVRSIKVLERL